MVFENRSNYKLLMKGIFRKRLLLLDLRFACIKIKLIIEVFLSLGRLL